MPDYNALNSSLATATQAAGIVAQGKTNRKTREWNEKMAQQQRSWALQDWDKTNMYNSPQNQMRLLKEAGLNPNLIYGHGTEASKTSDPRGTDVKSWNPETPNYAALANSMGGYQDANLKTAQVDMMQKQLDVLDSEIENKRANTYATGVNAGLIDVKTAREKIALLLDENAYSADLQAREIKARKGAADLQFTLDENERRKLRSTSDLKTAVQMRLSMAQTRLNQQEQIYASMQGREESKSRMAQQNQVTQESIQRSKNLVQQLKNLQQAFETGKIQQSEAYRRDQRAWMDGIDQDDAWKEMMKAAGILIK